MLAQKMSVHSCMYTPIWQHLQVHATCFQTYSLHFPACHIFGQKIAAMTNEVTQVWLRS
jgi:hypothetical protein